MPIDVIIPNATPWVIKNADFAPGETYATSPGLNVMNMAVAEMARRGYVAGAQIKQAAADVEADKQRLALLQGLQSGVVDIPANDPVQAKAIGDDLKALGADIIDPSYPSEVTLTGPKVTGWTINVLGNYMPVFTLEPIRVRFPPTGDTTPTEVPTPDVVSNVGYQPLADVVTYTLRAPDGNTFTMLSVLSTATDATLIGPLPTSAQKQIAASIKPATLTAEIDKTIQISQGKQTYLQSLSTDYANFLNTTNNLLQDYLKMLSGVIAKLG